MSPGRHSRPRDDEIPAFSGDVPADLALAGRIVRRRFVAMYARTASGYGAAFTLFLGHLLVLGTPAAVLGLMDDHEVTAIVVLITLALATGVLSLTRLPGPARFFLGGVPAALLMAAATIAGESDDPALPGFLPGVLGVATLVTGAIHVFLGGSRFSAHFRRRLAEIDARRTTERGSRHMS